MESRNGDAAQTENADSSSSAEADEKWLPGTWLSKEWLSGNRLPRWTGREIYPERTFAVVLFTIVLIVGVGGGGYSWYQEVQETRRQTQTRKIAQKYSNPIYWPSNTVTTLDAKFQLVTKWIPADSSSENVDVEGGDELQTTGIRIPQGSRKCLEL